MDSSSFKINHNIDCKDSSPQDEQLFSDPFSLQSYCIDSSDILLLEILDFDSPNLRDIEQLAIMLGSRCEKNKSLYQTLSKNIIKTIHSMTSDYNTQTKLFNYSNTIARRARWYSSQNSGNN